MCIIVILEPFGSVKKDIDKKTLELCFKSNNDGVGYSSVWNNEKGKYKVVTKKGVMTFEEFYTMFSKDRVDNPLSMFLVHFRYSTQGEDSNENCHPFELDNGNAAFAHNGTMTSFSDQTKKKSDSHVLADCLNTLPSGWYNDPSYQYLFNSMIVGINRAAILTKNNKVWYFNQAKWIKEDGILYSNDYFKKERCVASTTVTTYPSYSAQYVRNTPAIDHKKKEPIIIHSKDCLCKKCVHKKLIEKEEEIINCNIVGCPYFNDANFEICTSCTKQQKKETKLEYADCKSCGSLTEQAELDVYNGYCTMCWYQCS